ncbi:uncharacterized protein LOC62_04G005326 [Vanrija pseudolonga]|uniref:F-box domain-containing protein n=1 Tax=Vanrija pseudolonga TaxID=143232 RepID=A0AAF0Y839_9TREE|nr:hypothetical protein LOC62_04G005326 [Vanrija pseudolonga]
MTDSTLDYAAYPHLVEAIVSYASLTALVSLRATCRALHALVDARLFTHAQLHDFPNTSDDWSSAVTYGLTLPLRSTIPHTSRMPHLPRAAAAVSTLDVCFELVPPVVAKRFTSLRTLRRRLNCVAHFDDPFLRVETAVYFITVPAQYIVVARLPRSLDRLVLHIKHEGTGSPARGFRLVSNEHNIQQFEFVIWPSPRTPPAVWFFQAMFETVDSGRANGTGSDFSITLAGLEKVYPSLWEGSPDLDHAADAEGVKRAIRDCLHTALDLGHVTRSNQSAFIVDAICDRLRVLTLEEWQSELGDRLELEGTWMEPGV